MIDHLGSEKVVLYGGDYEHTLALAGSHEGLVIDYHHGSPSAIFAKMIAERAYEACEFSLANLLILRDQGADWLSAIPVFPNRAFRHHTLFVRRDSDIQSPADLRGRRIGLEDYSMTAAVWVRGFLNEDYGVNWRDVAWFCDNRQGRFSPPAEANVTLIEDDPESMLEAGTVDAIMSFGPRDERRPPGDRKLRRLFHDAQKTEQGYYERTGIYPINHCVTIRNDVLERIPSLPKTLFNTYLASKKAAYQRKLGTTLVPWAKLYWPAAFEIFGGDPLPYGLTDSNKAVVAKLGVYLHEQKLIRKIPSLDSLFLSESLAYSE
jgi:4,5-dihydroxyphthalate decarboxylase